MSGVRGLRFSKKTFDAMGGAASMYVQVFRDKHGPCKLDFLAHNLGSLTWRNTPCKTLLTRGKHCECTVPRLHVMFNVHV